MSRITSIKEILFPVKTLPVYACLEEEDSERRLPIPQKKAIVHGTTNRILGVVCNKYQLITNSEAVEMGLKCCAAAFPQTKESEWQIHTVDAPASAAHCAIDFKHNSAHLDFHFVPPNLRPDSYGPFLRVVNSYNTSRSLSFNIGFLRKVCQNGLILPVSIIKLHFPHLQNGWKKEFKFRIESGALANSQKTFFDEMATLGKCQVPRENFIPLLFHALGIPSLPKSNPSEKETEARRTLLSHLNERSDHYAKELGENAYAILNTITDFASRPPQNCLLRRDRNGFQRLAGTWVADFVPRCKRHDFRIADHLKSIEKLPSETPS